MILYPGRPGNLGHLIRDLLKNRWHQYRGQKERQTVELPRSLPRPAMILAIHQCPGKLAQTHGFQKIRNPSIVICICTVPKTAQQICHLLTSLGDAGGLIREDHNITPGLLLHLQPVFPRHNVHTIPPCSRTMFALRPFTSTLDLVRPTLDCWGHN